MRVFLYFKSGKKLDFIPQIRLTRSRNGTTGTAVFEFNLKDNNILYDTLDAINGVAVEKNNLLRMADICNFVWSSGKPIKLVSIFIFTTLEEKQDFFNVYPKYAISNNLEFFPSLGEKKTLNKK
uniref:Photosystem II reaction center Psb28 protein n=1 Tax=Eustigmatophyceae sp. Bat 8/9-7w TaxID=2506144 RepID=A0A3R5U932_9STRA|nr:photosystem II protein psb28 [Eustigmatophyceae sp. Bat 8/9-7w]QAA11450.1 photosystem II protein psb28 [Eustigmatophyceae sp. Bat 8/9-7w]